jgi:ClpP class serine protease
LSAEDLLSGRIWSGEKGVEHGLADGIGELRRVLRERYGQKLRLRPISRQRGWLQRRFAMEGQSAADSLLDNALPAMLAYIEEDTLWRRYGL